MSWEQRELDLEQQLRYGLRSEGERQREKDEEVAAKSTDEHDTMQQVHDAAAEMKVHDTYITVYKRCLSVCVCVCVCVCVIHVHESTILSSCVLHTCTLYMYTCLCSWHWKPSCLKQSLICSKNLRQSRNFAKISCTQNTKQTLWNRLSKRHKTTCYGERKSSQS